MMNNRPTPNRVKKLLSLACVEEELPREFRLGTAEMKHGDVAIAAITSCTNTSNPSVMLAAGLLAKKVKAAKEFAAKASDRVRSHFPDWEVRAEALVGTASLELIRKADEWNPDLVVV